MMSDRPNTACPPDGRYIEVLACNTGIADQNGNASVTLRNNSPYTVTGVTLALFGTDASKAGSMIPPVEAVSPPVPRTRNSVLRSVCRSDGARFGRR